MSREINLDPKRLCTKTEMAAYMKEVFSLAEDGSDIDLETLKQALMNVEEETEIVLTPTAVTAICRDDFAYKTLVVLGAVCQENPHIHIRFREEPR